MPFSFTLPTTAFISLLQNFSSNTHPSLPATATERRAHLRNALKTYKRLPTTSQPANLPFIHAALTSYIPYLFAIDAGLCGRKVANEEVDIVLLRDTKITWRCTLTASSVGDGQRTSFRSLDTDIYFVLSTLAYVHTLQAREALRLLYRADTAPPSPETRKQAVTTAMRHLLQSNGLHAYLLQWRNSGDSHIPQVADMSAAVLCALSSLSLAEATLIAVLKDDPYPIAVAELRNTNSKDWMFRAPELVTSRLNLLVRLCVGAADHAEQAAASLKNTKGVHYALVTYVDDLKRTAKAKAARFQAVIVEGEGRTGEAIAWIRGAKQELGMACGEEEGRKGGMLSKFKYDWKEKREDKKIQKGGNDWGADAGKYEEGRVLEMLETKWVKVNDTMTMQIIPPSEPLMATLPTGREFHKPQLYTVPTLDDETLSKMRAPPEPRVYGYDGEHSGSESEGFDHEEHPGTSKPYPDDNAVY